MTKDEALKLALDALQSIANIALMDSGHWARTTETEAISAITAIKAALAQEQTPVAWMDAQQPWDLYKNKPQVDAIPLYTVSAPT
mgnify:CR=1 FL=1